MQVSVYRSFLRTMMLVTALVLVFDSGVLSPTTRQLSDSAIQFVASVGVGATATVPENEMNVFTAELAEEKRKLELREAKVSEREIAARAYESGEGEADYSVYIISVILFILTVLLVLNFAMDWARVRALKYEKPAT